VHGPTIAHEETVVVEIYDGPHFYLTQESAGD
jgi:hypothetical protein